MYKKKDKLYLENIIISIIIGLYFADLHSGLVHIFFDEYEGDNPFLKPIADAFQGHHKSPINLIKKPTIENITDTAITPYNIYCLLYNITKFTSKSQIIIQLSFLLGSNFGQITHQLAHFVNHASKKEKKQFKYRITKLLQEYNIIIKTEEHRKHHQTYDTNFCLLNGWANPLLNSIYTFGNTAKQISNKI